MKIKVSILYSWIIRTVTILLPNIPICMRLRGFLYSLMMKKCGRNFQVTSSAIINALSGLDVGNNVYIGPNTVVLGLDIQIHDEVLIGPNCVLAAGSHTSRDGSFRFGAYTRGKIIIEKGSWVAGNCTVLAGARLPKGSVLGAGAVLNKSFEMEGALYGGIPAKFINELQNNS